jgi:hypothetical protein
MISGLPCHLVGMQLGFQAAFGAPDTSGNSLAEGLAAVRCAFEWVASISADRRAADRQARKILLVPCGSSG